ncbi:ATP-binding cassette sub-family A member [Elysia marginata]|uniref:ATP-binding cassette sub-family A member n=1 Tax=Elysia marginata TaxID=1093978 RepID=A0AAV4FZR8_9GAST|nr:ATP-binding cassette sub-family A member [Elysia marginata]
MFPPQQILGLELLWPVLVMGLVALMRHGAPPFRKPNCLYQPRAMPSAGAVPFLQTYLCNLDNPCYITDSELDDAIRNTRSFSAMTQDAAPYLASQETMNVLDISNQSIQVINTMNSVIRDQNLTEGLNTFMNVSQYFRDPDEAKRILVMKLTGSPDFEDIACHPNKLAMYLDFPRTIMTPSGPAGAASVGDVSRALCNVTSSEIPGLTDAVVGQLDVVKIMEALKLFEQLKEKFTGSSLSLIFGELADMFELVLSSKSVVQALGDFAAVPEISNLIRQIPSLMEGFDDLSDAFDTVKSIVDSLNPIMASLGEVDNRIWSAVQNAVKTGTHVGLLVEQRWNGTTQEFMQPLLDLVADLRNISQDSTGQTLVGALEFLSKQNWPDIYKQISNNGSLDERTVIHMLDSLEKMLKMTPGFDVVEMMSRLAQHALDVGSIFTEQSIELRKTLYSAVQQSDALQERLNRFLSYGPGVTKVLLESLQKSDFFASLFTGTANYTGVCDIIVKSLYEKVPADLAQDVRNTICTEDAINSLSVFLGSSAETVAIFDVVNRTVEMFTQLYEGDFWARKVPLRELYYHYTRFYNAITLYTEDVLKWGDLMMGPDNNGMNGLNTNLAEWESLMAMFNEDYLIRGIFGLYRGFGGALTNSPLTEVVRPYVHIMSRTVEMTYDVMYGMTQTYSITSPLMSVASLVTGYLPEIVLGVAHMAETSTEPILKIAASDDPLLTFCTDDVLGQMAMPSYVPVDQMTDLACKTNWSQAIENFIQPVTQIQNMVTEVKFT